MHHHLIGAPWRSRKKPVARRSHVLAALVERGAELILAGHIHQAAVSERHEFEVIAGASAESSSRSPPASASRARTGGARRAACTCTSGTRATIRVETYVWRDDDWGLTAVRTFARGREPLLPRGHR